MIYILYKSSDSSFMIDKDGIRAFYSQILGEDDDSRRSFCCDGADFGWTSGVSIDLWITSISVLE